MIISKPIALIKPFYIVIFGGDGDLSKRKILPALYQRFMDGQLDVDFRIIAVSRKDSGNLLLEELKTFIPLQNENEIKLFAEFCSHVTILVLPENKVSSYEPLLQLIHDHSDWQRVFYFSVPSAAYEEICQALKDADLIDKKSK